MDETTARKIIDLNYQFYQTFAGEFSATRHRLQPGVKRLLEDIPAGARLLDLGCGNGELWRELARRRHIGRYLGVDFSLPLLMHAAPESPTAQYMAFDLASPDWSAICARGPFELATAFAVLHHIPGKALRVQMLRQLHACLAPHGRVFLSNWQFLNSPRLAARIQPWERVELSAAQVDAGDYLLDWRQGGEGLRYAHHFSPDELADLAVGCGFSVVETFLSDGQGEKLGLYQVWKKSPEV